MQSFKSLVGVGLAQLMVLGSLAPAVADTSESDAEHRRQRSRKYAQPVSHDRGDYPVIVNWLASPESADIDSDPA